MLRIGDNFLLFESTTTSAGVDIFYDSSSQRVCEVRDNGQGGITARALSISPSSVDSNNDLTFRIRNKGKIRSIGFSTDLKIVSVQREDSAMDFIILDAVAIGNGEISSTDNDSPSNFLQTLRLEIRQPCQHLDGIILGVRWVSCTQVLLVTDQGPELYLINSRRRSSKLVKAFNLPVSWSQVHLPSQLLIFAGGNGGNFSLMIFQNNTVYELGLLKVEFGCSYMKPKLFEKDVVVGSIYEKIAILVLFFNDKMPALVEKVNVYEFSDNENPLQLPVLTHILQLNLTGLTSLTLTDNIIVVHNKNSKRSLLFDVLASGHSSDDGVNQDASKLNHKTHMPLCSVKVVVAAQLLLEMGIENPSELSLYSNNAWRFFSPNVLINPWAGILTNCILHVEESNRKNLLEQNADRFMDFLANRLNSPDSKNAFLLALKCSIEERVLSPSKLPSIFERILEPKEFSLDNSMDMSANKLLVSSPMSPSSFTSNFTGKPRLYAEPYCPLIIDHVEIMCSVFCPLQENLAIDRTLLSNFVLEFFHSVKQKRIPMEFDYLPEFLIKILAEAKQYSKLHQLLQQRVIEDSKFWAFELIGLSEHYAPLKQMALDMLSRRENQEQIAEVYVAEGRVIRTLRCLRDCDLDKTLCLRLLETAWLTNNRQIKFTVFQHLRFVKELAFLDDEEFRHFVVDYESLYPPEEIEETEQRAKFARLSSIRRPIPSLIVENSEQQDLSSVHLDESGTSTGFREDDGINDSHQIGSTDSELSMVTARETQVGSNDSSTIWSASGAQSFSSL